LKATVRVIRVKVRITRVKVFWIRIRALRAELVLGHGLG